MWETFFKKMSQIIGFAYDYESLGIEQGTNFVFQYITYYFSFNVIAVFKEHSIDILIQVYENIEYGRVLTFPYGNFICFTFKYAISWSFG